MKEADPISLEPLSELGYPPFELVSEGSEGEKLTHWFDGQVSVLKLVVTR